MTSDVRGQLKVLEKIDRISASRREEKEKEKIFRAAKSRSKQDDPELAKMKEQAKQVMDFMSGCVYPCVCVCVCIYVHMLFYLLFCYIWFFCNFAILFLMWSIVTASSRERNPSKSSE